MCYGPIQMNVFYFCMGKCFCRCMSDLKFIRLVNLWPSSPPDLARIFNLVLCPHIDERFLLLYGEVILQQHVREFRDIFKPIGEGFSDMCVNFQPKGKHFSGTLKDIQHILVPLQAKFMDIRAILVHLWAIVHHICVISIHS